MEKRSIRNWTIRGVYLYLVCMVMLGVAAAGAGRVVFGTLDLLNPPPPGAGAYADYPIPDGKPALDPALVQAQRDLEAERASAQDSFSAINRCLGGGAMVLVALPLYFLNWRRIRREERGGAWPRVEWAVRNVYYHLVCFVALIAVLVSGIGVLHGAAACLWSPPPAYGPGPMDIYYQQYSGAGQKVPPVTAILAEADEARRSEDARAAYERTQSILHYAATLIIAVPIFLYHWRKIQLQFAAAVSQAAAEAGPGPG